MDLEAQKEVWRKEQLDIASRVEILPDPPHENRFRVVPMEANDGDDVPSTAYYGGVDVSFPTDEADPSVAVYVVLEHPSGRVVYQDSMYFNLEVPYIPSYLAFREIGPLETLIRKQMQDQPEMTPKAILVDGNGVLHPRKAGIACFVGVKTGIPTIGVGKTLFYEGKLNKDVVLKELEDSLLGARNKLTDNNDESGDNSVLIVDSEVIPKENSSNSSDEKPKNEGPDRGALVQELSSVCRGVAVPLVNEAREVLACALVGHGGRTRVGKKPSAGTKNPVYISVGHSISLEEAVRISANLSFAKIPEPVRQADLIGRELLRQKEQQVGYTKGRDRKSVV